MNTPSIMTVSEYVQKKGINCPACGSLNISAGNWDDKAKNQDVSCGDCDSCWVENYDLVNYVELVDGDCKEVAIPVEPYGQEDVLEAANELIKAAKLVVEQIGKSNMSGVIQNLHLAADAAEYTIGKAKLEIQPVPLPVTNNLHELILDLYDSADNCGCEHPYTVCDEDKLLAVYLESKRQKSEQPPHLAVVLDGGLVQSIISDKPEYFAGVKAMVIDYDTDSLDPNDETLGLIEQDDGAIAAGYIRGESIAAAGILLGKADAFINETAYGATQQRLAVCGDNPCEGCPDLNSDGTSCVNQEQCLAWQFYDAN